MTEDDGGLDGLQIRQRADASGADLEVTLKDSSTQRPGRLTVDLDARPTSDGRSTSHAPINLRDLERASAPIGVTLRRRPSSLHAPVLRVGSGEGCDVVVSHPVVAPVHAELRNTARGPHVLDVSGSGTGVVVNGHYVRESYLTQGDRVAVGPAHFVVDDDRLVPLPSTSAARLEAYGVSVTVGRRTILQPTWLSVQPGELVALLGPSGAGKTTLLKALAGVRAPTAGAVRFDGDQLETRRSEIGYVPQDEIVHPGLTVREAVTYAARLRLPRGAARADRRAAVERVIDEVGLAAHATSRIGSLSGGQRKRVGVATELVARPGLLFLDEPTSGLDPSLERRMMDLLRVLADGGRSVLLVTHATKSLALCDRVVVIGEGGLLAFCGRAERALEFFRVASFDDIYAALERAPSQAWQDEYLRSPEGRAEYARVPTATDPRAGSAPAAPILPQLWTLTRRYAKLFARDRRTLLTIAIQVPVLALATGLLFGREVFDLPAAGADVAPEDEHAGESAQLLFLLVTIALWFGAIASAREIVKERTVLARELNVGVRVPAYLASKLLVLLVVAGAETLGLVAIVFTLRPLGEPPGTYAGVIVLLLLTTAAAVGMGLIASAIARSEDQATSLIPLLLVPQLLFGGAVVPLEQIAQPLKLLSGLVAAQWAFAGVGTTVDMNERIALNPLFEKASRYGTDFFDVPAPAAGIVLGVFLAVSVGVVARRVSVRHRSQS